VVAATTIDGGEYGNVISFISGEGQESILDGLTITNGGTMGRHDALGGGVVCLCGSSPTITHNVIGGNGGGGVLYGDGAAVVSNNKITGKSNGDPAADRSG